MTISKQALGPRQQALVDALRSGDFVQSTSRLRTGDSYCCLGVACQLSGLGEWLPKEEGFLGREYKVGVATKQYTILPQLVAEFYKFKTTGGHFFQKDGRETQLTQLNDDGMSFHEIARVIEENAAAIFTEEA